MRREWIPLRPTLEENFQITPKFWADCAKDGTIGRLAGMMDTPIYGLMGVSTCNEKDEWEYYVAVASTKETNEYEEKNYDAIKKLIRSELGE